MGVAAIPDCSGDNILCNMINYVARNMVYFTVIQDFVGPAGYFRDPHHMTQYYKDSVFLPYANAEDGTDEQKAAVKAKFTSLNAVMLTMFTEDSVVYPRQSEWFYQLDDDYNVLTLDQTTWYNDDVLGLKTLNEAGKVTFNSIEGDHLQFSDADITNTFVPFLLS